MPSPKTADSDQPVIVLFRQDLRIADNRALSAAAETGRPVVCVFIRDDGEKDFRARGAAKNWWLHRSLEALSVKLHDLGATLILRTGDGAKLVPELVAETGADTVFWNRRYDPPAVEADKAMKAALRSGGIDCESFDGHLLHEPWALKTSSGGFYKVYSPFWRGLLAQDEPRPPATAPARIGQPARLPKSESLADWALLPKKPDWASAFSETWTPGEEGAQERLKEFLSDAIRGYGENRDRPDMESTSRLSPHLSLGEITPFQIWAALDDGRRHLPAQELQRKLRGISVAA
jgi:deoxyribodipyrimidine photo-lyase